MTTSRSSAGVRDDARRVHHKHREASSETDAAFRLMQPNDPEDEGSSSSPSASAFLRREIVMIEPNEVKEHYGRAPSGLHRRGAAARARGRSLGWADLVRSINSSSRRRRHRELAESLGIDASATCSTSAAARWPHGFLARLTDAMSRGST